MSFGTFRLLMWKNMKQLLRHYIITTVAIVLPVLLMVLLVLIRFQQPKRNDEEFYNSYCPIKTEEWCSFATDEENKVHERDMPELLPEINFSELSVAYSPSGNKLIDEAMARMARWFELGVRPFKSPAELEAYFATRESKSTFGGVVFHPAGIETMDGIPREMTLHLRFSSELRGHDREQAAEFHWDTDSYYYAKPYQGPRSGGLPIGEYTRQGFVALQMMLTKCLIDVQTGAPPHGAVLSEFFPEMRLKRFPCPGWVKETKLLQSHTMLTSLTVFAFLFVFVWMVRVMVREKEKQLDTVMWIMGVRTWARMTSWFFSWYGLLLIVMVPVSVIIAVPWYPVTANQGGKKVTIFVTILVDTNPLVAFLFFALYAAALITFAVAMTTFFSHVAPATFFSPVFFVLTLIPYIILTENNDGTSDVITDAISNDKVIISCLLVNTALSFGMRIMLELEEIGVGAQFENLWQTSNAERKQVLGMILIMFGVDIVLYILLACYIEAVFPTAASGTWGLPWNFCLKRRFWSCCGKSEELRFRRLTYITDEYVEPDPPDSHIGVRFINVWKIYDNNVVAVKDLTIRMYEGQVNTFLGQQGSGTRAVMALLTGIMLPTAGTLLMQDLDVRENALEIRHNLGYCPLHNILYYFLTIEEHFYLYSKIKGVPTADIHDDTEYYIEALNLQKERKRNPSGLSNETKRKLSVALAFCGRSRIVCLDMPAKGLDFGARKSVWDFIRSLTAGRTVIVRTELMDGAEMLSDRIAVMVEGELQCFGSVKFLKKKFGAGCYLSLFVEKQHHLAAISRVLEGYIPDIDEPVIVPDKSEDGVIQFRYLLPVDKMGEVARLLQDLERSKSSLGIKSYWVYVTTLDEIFLRIYSFEHRPSAVSSFTDKPRPTFEQRYKRPLKIHTGCNLLLNQILALLLKRIILFSRRLDRFCMVMLMMMFLLWLAMSGNVRYPKLLSLPDMPLAFAKFPLSSIIVKLLDAATINDIGQALYEKYRAAYDAVTSTYGYKTKTIGTNDMSAHAIEERRRSVQLFNQLYVIGLSFYVPQVKKAPRLIMWYNDYPVHAEGVAASFGLNVIYNLNTNKTIKFVNSPLPFRYEVQTDNHHTRTLQEMRVTLVLMLIMCIATAFPIFFYVTENVSKSRLLQFLSGVKIWLYLIVHFLFDFAIYLFMVLVITLQFETMEKEHFETSNDMHTIFVLLVTYGVAIIPMQYVVSKLYKTPAFGFVRNVMISYILVLILMGFGLLFRLMDLRSMNSTHHVLLIIPLYALGDAFQRYQKMSRRNDTCTEAIYQCELKRTKEQCHQRYCNHAEYLGFTCCRQELRFLDLRHGHLGKNIIYLGVFGTAMVVVAFLIEYKWFRSLAWVVAKVLQKTKPIPEEDEGADVGRERKRISQYPESGKDEYHVVLQELTKNFGSALALNGLSVGIGKGECLGILGQSGCGKSVMFQLLTGDLRTAYGAFYIAGQKLGNRRSQKFNSLIGYCPQKKGLFETMSVRQTMMIYCLIRGVALEDCRLFIEKLAVDFEFLQQLKLQVKHLSESNRRKLNCALAMIGDPMVLLLDEPTSGMDARSRMKTWKVLSRAKQKGATIVLTTHSMEECELLCSRIGVMVKGNLNCLGSLQNLKERFSKGYTVTIRLKPVADLVEKQVKMEEILQYFHGSFEKTLLIEKSHVHLKMFTENEKMSCSKLFIEMEKAKKKYHIKDYSIGQTRLEQILLHFTRHQVA